MNTYRKYCPNVFVAKCETEHKKGDVIILTTKYGKEHEHEVHNFLGKDREGYFLYSITRTDGFNAQERAKRKAEKLQGYSSSATKRSNAAYENADMSEATTGIPFGQPILIGHHSERKHRKVLERADNAMRKSIEEQDKAEQYTRRAEYWEKKTEQINLSMPESLEYYEYELEKAKIHHKDLKDNPEKRAHSFSLTYAKKEVNNMKKSLDLAVKLWGSQEEQQQIDLEKKEAAEKKYTKQEKVNKLIKEVGGFFAFNNEQFREGYKKILEDGIIEEGEKVKHIHHGLYVPSKNVDTYLDNYKTK